MEEAEDVRRHLAPPAQHAAAADEGEARLLSALRAGDEAAFLSLVERHQPSMQRIAMLYVASREAAEEVVQETWLAVFEGVARFEGRSSLKTWIFSILANRAKTRGAREKRSVPLASLADDGSDDGPSIDEACFLGPESAWPGHWETPPRAWSERPESVTLSAELRGRIDGAIRALPDSQRRAITLRDIEGLETREACNILGVGETNLRVLLHRARGRVRRALESYFEGGRAS